MSAKARARQLGERRSRIVGGRFHVHQHAGAARGHRRRSVARAPLLIKGEPGTGKTELAFDVARRLGMPLFRWHIKSIDPCPARLERIRCGGPASFYVAGLVFPEIAHGHLRAAQRVNLVKPAHRLHE